MFWASHVHHEISSNRLSIRKYCNARQLGALSLEPPKIMTDESEMVAKRRKVEHPGTGAHAWPSSHGPAYQTVAPVAQSAAQSAAAPPATTAWPGSYPAHSWPESERSLLGSARLSLDWLPQLCSLTCAAFTGSAQACWPGYSAGVWSPYGPWGWPGYATPPPQEVQTFLMQTARFALAGRLS